jgi:cytoplasmic iron level regulating protein YaaA (DUF328/UPF0246 family)
MIILLHSSKTMKASKSDSVNLRRPLLIDKSNELNSYLRTLSVNQIAKVMSISQPLALKTHKQMQEWNNQQSLAIDSFVGDIYSGLQSSSLNKSDREYADKHLFILSGLYGVIRPLDYISPYRLEMAYRLPKEPYKNLYKFWGDSLASCLPADDLIVNTSSVEYFQAISPYIKARNIVTPKFLTRNKLTGEPTFVVVHAKIARGAFARWLIVNKIDDLRRFSEFDDIGYKYSPGLSSQNEPTYICQEFGGIGLSVRLV